MQRAQPPDQRYPAEEDHFFVFLPAARRICSSSRQSQSRELLFQALGDEFEEDLGRRVVR
jgi:hypothetical protein